MMKRQRLARWVLGFSVVLWILTGCSMFRVLSSPTGISPKLLTPAPSLASTNIVTMTTTTTPILLTDPCTGWRCNITGVVYVGKAEFGSELEGVKVTLNQYSYCSPTSGQYQTKTDSSGKFEFGDVFFHDTDRIQIQVESEGYTLTQWNSIDFSCIYCSCFGTPLEIVLLEISSP